MFTARTLVSCLSIDKPSNLLNLHSYKMEIAESYGD